MSARGQGDSGVSAPEQSNTVNGKPVMAWKIPVIAQPLRSHLFQPPLPPQQLRSKKSGTSQMKLPMKRCITSKSDLPLSFLGSNGESEFDVKGVPQRTRWKFSLMKGYYLSSDFETE